MLIGVTYILFRFFYRVNQRIITYFIGLHHGLLFLLLHTFNMPGLFQRFTFFRFLSIEVMLDALAMAIFAVKWLHAEPPVSWWPVLCVSVWIIYTTDHLIDAWQLKGNSTIARHQFHYKNFFPLISAVFILSAVNLFVIFNFFEIEIIVTGILLALLVMVYFTALFFKNRLTFSLPKELIVALVFVSGVWFTPLLIESQNADILTVVVVFIFVGLAFCEGVMVSWFEYAQDKKDSHTSFAFVYGKVISRKMLRLILLIICISIIFLFRFSTGLVENTGLIVLLTMDIVLIMVISRPDWFAKNGLYRIVGDLVFMLPAAIYWI